jgi:hypothetical protein
MPAKPGRARLVVIDGDRAHAQSALSRHADIRRGLVRAHVEAGLGQDLRPGRPRPVFFELDPGDMLWP